MTSLRTLALLLICGVAVVVRGEVTTVPIPGEGWRISFDAPPLKSKQDSRAPIGYAFKANAGRFNLSAFIETPKGEGRTNKDCYEAYWRDASRNPMIRKDSVSVSEHGKFVRVAYDVEAVFDGRKIRQHNVNYYFVHRGRWVDVHISIIEPTEADKQIFEAFDRSLTYTDDPS